MDLGIDVVDVQRVQSFMNLLINNSFRFTHLVEKFTSRKSSCVELLLVYKIAVHGNQSIHLKGAMEM